MPLENCVKHRETEANRLSEKTAIVLNPKDHTENLKE
ncbi:hypothetical protein CBM2615_B60058 [Cupriavidus taiwanensis]|uniref:Uncharacterized protein n=1 Tax=Cupriavidus taiwanensis TaxID=164546 RepID=A0A375EC78_9BURK|nr:hypothetical protein CBM2614_B50056 [Cupriavidus taiwanensis]SOZ69700.1 hypothetical protein CBM2615_B60058 [Cupriavidus taiwanensis]SOZ72909.1 hypothetical protein CBM2613_B50057 [Cupriavidus taiwanensis]SPA09767.1 hypothetical protein CBM2625_B50056 [Cupriavidus taiwanensis]